MVIFNELRFVDNKTEILVDCFIEGLSIYKNMYIESIAVEYYRNASSSGDASDKAIYIYEDTDIENPKKNVTVKAGLSIERNKTEIKEKFGIDSFSNGLFYVIVQCAGDLEADTSSYPCGYDITKDTGVVLDWETIYSIGMQYIAIYSNEKDNVCQNFPGFDNFIIAWNSLNMAISSCDYALIRKIYEKLLCFAGDAKNLFIECNCGK